jgi:uncharacterized protein (DUF1499 family)
MAEQRTKGSMVSYLVAGGLVLALAAVVCAALAGFGSRLNFWHFRTGFAMLKWAAYGGAAAVLVSLAGAIAAGRGGHWRGVIFAVAGIAVGGAVFAVPYSWRLKAQSVPPIHDITTDIAKPPQFVAILPLRQGAPNPATYGGPEVAVKQLEAYPDIQPLLLNVSLPQAFEQALAPARAMGWRIVAAEPKEGRIEASDTTFWFGFTDDIVVRITAVDEHRSLVDVRSVSRVGRSDVGTNAKRIREYLRRLAAGK